MIVIYAKRQSIQGSNYQNVTVHGDVKREMETKWKKYYINN